jgi:hypothetical protein
MHDKLASNARTTAEDCFIAENPEADPNTLRKFLADLNERGIFIWIPEETLPAGAALLSNEDVIRETNPIVMAPDGQTPVVLSWGRTRLFETADTTVQESDESEETP